MNFIGSLNINLYGKPIKNFEYIDLEIHSNFLYLINELTINFTRFELAEFMALSGKYIKLFIAS